MDKLGRSLLIMSATIGIGAAGITNAGEVVVSFPGSEKYSDLNDAQYDVRSTLELIEKHLQQLGKSYLPPGQTLKIDVLDIDLAGEEEWRRRNPFGVRVLRDITWPRMQVHYTLEENGAMIRSADESIADASYLSHTSRYFTSDRLRYEKQMLDTWFRNRFVASR